MGTRYMVFVSIDGQNKIAQYGQSDGYPKGAGKVIQSFFQTADLGDFKAKVRSLRAATEEEFLQAYIKAGTEEKQIRAEGWDNFGCSFEVLDVVTRDWPAFSRETGARILAAVASGKSDSVKDWSDWDDGGWAYIIDLDREIVQVFNGEARPWRIGSIGIGALAGEAGWMDGVEGAFDEQMAQKRIKDLERAQRAKAEQARVEYYENLLVRAEPGPASPDCQLALF